MIHMHIYTKYDILSKFDEPLDLSIYMDVAMHYELGVDGIQNLQSAIRKFGQISYVELGKDHLLGVKRDKKKTDSGIPVTMYNIENDEKLDGLII